MSAKIRFDTRKYLYSSVEVVHHSRQPETWRKKFKFYFPAVGVSKEVNPPSPVDLFQGPACTIVLVGSFRPPLGTNGANWITFRCRYSDNIEK